MTNAGALMLAAWTSGAVAEGTQYHSANHHVFEPAMFARGDTCPELPKLCTDSAMLHGIATSLTYLCPEPAGLATVHVTKTVTTTVTAVPTAGNGDSLSIEEPNQSSLVSHDHTTTTTIKSTLTQHRTVTVFSKKSGPTASLPSPINTGYFSEGMPLATPILSPTLLPPYITWSFSEGIPPSGQAEGTGPRSQVNTSSSSSTVNATYHTPTAIYQNATSRGGYAKPTVNRVREAKVSETMFPVKGVAGRNGAYSLTLFFGLVAAARIL